MEGLAAQFRAGPREADAGGESPYRCSVSSFAVSMHGYIEANRRAVPELGASLAGWFAVSDVPLSRRAGCALRQTRMALGDALGRKATSENGGSGASFGYNNRRPEGNFLEEFSAYYDFNREAICGYAWGRRRGC